MNYHLAKIRRRQLVWWCLTLGLCSVMLGWFINRWIEQSGAKRVFAKVENVPPHDVGLVLGTSAKVAGGYENPFFRNRIEAAAALYRAGKVRHLILSGDNHVQGYDEPSDMQAALLERGVPLNALTLDYAGFRTLDSVVRAKAVFGQTRITIISDDFHLPRALFLASAYQVDAIGFSSAPVAEIYARKTKWRESFARLKAMLDVYVFGTQPKFYGPPVEIKLASGR
jgi:SanA protein